MKSFRRLWRDFAVCSWLLCLLATSAEEKDAPLKVYRHVHDSQDYPFYGKRHYRGASRKVFNYTIKAEAPLGRPGNEFKITRAPGVDKNSSPKGYQIAENWKKVAELRKTEMEEKYNALPPKPRHEIDGLRHQALTLHNAQQYYRSLQTWDRIEKALKN